MGCSPSDGASAWLDGADCRGDFTIFRDRLQKDVASHVHNATTLWLKRKQNEEERQEEEGEQGGERKPEGGREGVQAGIAYFTTSRLKTKSLETDGERKKMRKKESKKAGTSETSRTGSDGKENKTLSDEVDTVVGFNYLRS